MDNPNKPFELDLSAQNVPGPEPVENQLEQTAGTSEGFSTFDAVQVVGEVAADPVGDGMVEVVGEVIGAIVGIIADS